MGTGKLLSILEFCCSVLHKILKGFLILLLTVRVCVCIDVGLCLVLFFFLQVALAVEGSTMSGSLQRRKKSKRKWKRLWFLLKDKVLYTFTAREVRGHRVSPHQPQNSGSLQSQNCQLAVFASPILPS